MTAARSPAREALAALKRDAIGGALRLLPDERSVAIQYWRAHKRWPDLKAPKRYTEKLQWLKLYGGLEAHSDWIDKVLAKPKVAAVLGERWITPTLWHGTALPAREERTWPTPYVLKANHGSGWCLHVVRDADKEWPAIEKKSASWLRQRWHPQLLERQYDAIVPQFLVEPRLGGTTDIVPYDYKFHVFGGRVRCFSVSVDRLQNLKIAMRDRDGEPLPFVLDGDLPRPETTPPLPPHFADMIDGAERLGGLFPYARIDFYDLADGPRFGEVTLVPASGFKKIDPDDWDERLGEWLELPAATRR